LLGKDITLQNTLILYFKQYLNIFWLNLLSKVPHS